MSSRYRNESSRDKYSTRYRFIKTIMMILAWIAFGIVCEIFSPALEDLKIYLNVDYNTLSFLMILKSFSYLCVITLGGVLFDKFYLYTDLLMFISTLFLIIRKYL